MFLKKLKDSVWNGVFIGLLSPVVLSCIAYFLIHRFSALAKADLLYIGSIAPNLAWMQLCFKLNKELIGKGILSATFICSFVFYFYKVF